MATRTRRSPRRASPGSRRKVPGRSRGVGESLRRYQEKRDFTQSREPSGDRAPATRREPRFVIQKHDASRLHYDFRLEMEGVLRSWAVPKGVPVVPGERHLAVEVEDHPIEYGSFEGTIPEGNYGAGTVMVWDQGNYQVDAGSPEEAYRAGKIHLTLAGQKCAGEWTLVKVRGSEGGAKTNWLLIKNRGADDTAPAAGGDHDRSVQSGRTLAEIARGTPPRKRTRSRGVSKTAKDVAPKTAARKKKARPTPGEPATFIAPMKAVSVAEVPAGPWRLELKFDGFRAIAAINDGAVNLWSRNHRSLAEAFPEVAAAVAELRCRNAVLDGEIVALDEAGRSHFQLLQNRGRAGTGPPVMYYVFDLLQLDGESLLTEPIEARQSRLEGLIGKPGKVVRVSPVFTVAAEELLERVRAAGGEGIIAKQPGSIYQPDRRSPAWLKCKVFGEQEFVIGGFTPPRNSRTHFGAILVGYYERGQLRYAGKVGSGFDRKGLASLEREFRRRQRPGCPFSDLPSPRRPRYGTGMNAAAMREVTWVEPELVAQVRFAEWTQEGLLRQPVFLGLRDDKPAREVRREAGPARGS